MNSLTGSMIELNVHMQTQKYADALMFIGIALGFITVVLFLIDLITSKKLTAGFLWYLLLIVISVTLFSFGFKAPRDKIISYCANGPVSIEQISTAYDIVEIDGKLIRLKERR